MKMFRFQNEAFLLGNQILAYMQSFINANRKRRGGTGNLAKSMKLETFAGAGTGMISWGIGKISDLMISAPYYYVVNYGKMITGQPYVPFHGKTVPGSFEGNHPNSTGGSEKFNIGDGSGIFMTPGKAIKPMGYIQATRHQLNVKLRILLKSLSRGK